LHQDLYFVPPYATLMFTACYVVAQANRRKALILQT